MIQLITWGITLVVARILSPSDYGLFGMALIYTGCIDYFNDMGLGTALVREKKLSPAQLSSLFWFTNLVGLACFAFGVATAPLVAHLFRQPSLTGILSLISLNFVLTSLYQIPWSILTKSIDFKGRSIAEAVGNVLSGFTTVVLAYHGYGVWALAWGPLIRSISITILVFSLAGWRPQLAFNWADTKAMVGFGVTMTGGRLAYYLYSSSPAFVIGKVLGESALGFYTLAYRLSVDVGDRLLNVLVQVSLPVYSKMQDDTRRLKTSFLQTIEIASGVVFPIYAGLFVVGKDVIPLLLGEKWTPVAQPFRFLTAAGIFWTLHAMVGPLLLARNRPMIGFRFNLVCLAVLPVSFYIGLQYGLFGVCIVWVSVYPFLVLFYLKQGLKVIECRWREFGRAIRPAMFGMLVMVLTTLLISQTITGCSAIWRLSILIPVGAVTYLSVFLVLYSRPISEIRTMFNRASPSVTFTS